jgi:hypothetical protein
MVKSPFNLICICVLKTLLTKTTLQRNNTKSSKQIFPEKELCGQSPNFHIYVYVSDLNIPMINLPFCCMKICGPILGILKSLTDT